MYTLTPPDQDLSKVAGITTINISEIMAAAATHPEAAEHQQLLDDLHAGVLRIQDILNKVTPLVEQLNKMTPEEIEETMVRLQGSLKIKAE